MLSAMVSVNNWRQYENPIGRRRVYIDRQLEIQFEAYGAIKS